MGGKGKFGILIFMALLLAGGALFVVYLMYSGKQSEISSLSEKVKKLEAEKVANATTNLVDSGISGGSKPQKVLVAIKPKGITPGEAILPQFVKEVTIPSALTPTNALTNYSQINGTNELVVTHDDGSTTTNSITIEKQPIYYIEENQIITGSMVRPKNEVTRSGYLVKPGMRYVSLPLDPVSQGVSAMLRIGGPRRSSLYLHLEDQCG